VLASGAGNTNLREALGKIGVGSVEEADPSHLLGSLAAAAEVHVEPREEDDRAGTEARPTTGEARRTAPEARPAEPRPPRKERGADELRAALSAAERPSVDALVPLIGALPRVHKAFPILREALQAFPPAEADARLAGALDPADRPAPEHTRQYESPNQARRWPSRRRPPPEAPPRRLSGSAKAGRPVVSVVPASTSSRSSARR
jgi:hypothetical protein